MGNSYIFAGEIRRLLEAGQLTIELAPGSKLSPSAADLIRDYGARVVFADPAAQAEKKAEAVAPPKAPPAPPPEAPPVEVKKEALAAAKAPAREIRAEVVREASGPIAEADVEEILRRVMARLEQATGRTYAPEAGSAAAPEPRSDDDLVICRCEEITKGQIRAAIAAGMSTLNGIKRVTRAGMGLCQGQTCQRLVTQILCQELGLTPDKVEPTTARPPTRPIPLELLATG